MIVVIVAPKTIFKLTPIPLDINMLYSRVNFSYCGGHYEQVLGFYGGFGCFCQNDGISMRKLKCTYGCRIIKCLSKSLGKVIMSYSLLGFEVMNEN